MPNNKEVMQINFSVPIEKGTKFKLICISKGIAYKDMLTKYVDQVIKVCLGDKPLEKFIAESGENETKK